MPEVAEPVSVREAAAMLGQATAVLVCWEEAPETASLREAVARCAPRDLHAAADARIAVVVAPRGASPRRRCSFFSAATAARAS